MPLEDAATAPVARTESAARRANKSWNPAEVRAVRAAMADGPLGDEEAADVAEALDRTPGAVRSKSYMIHAMERNRDRSWDVIADWRLSRLIEGGRTVEQAALELGRLEEAVRERCEERGLTGPGAAADRRPWTAGDDGVLDVVVGVHGHPLDRDTVLKVARFMNRRPRTVVERLAHREHRARARAARSAR